MTISLKHHHREQHIIQMDARSAMWVWEKRTSCKHLYYLTFYRAEYRIHLLYVYTFVYWNNDQSELVNFQHSIVQTHEAYTHLTGMV